jgi:hypothetical protein
MKVKINIFAESVIGQYYFWYWIPDRMQMISEIEERNGIKIKINL